MRPIHDHSPAIGPVMLCPRCRLDMAAPDLLDAVYMLLGCTDLNLDDLDETSIEAIEIARKAIKKAKGE